MSEPTAEMLNKLPKWAQEHVHLLARQLEDATNQLKEHLDSRTKSQLWTETGWPRQKAFIQDDRVKFGVVNGEIEIHIQDDGLYCMGIGGAIAICPRSTNTFTMKITPQ